MRLFVANENLKSELGQSVLEVVVALAIFALIGAVMASTMIGNFDLLLRSEEFTRANFLSREGVKIGQYLAGRTWNNLVFTKSSFATNTENKVALSGEGSEEIIDSQYIRFLEFMPVWRSSSTKTRVGATSSDAYLDPHSYYFRSVVRWGEGERINSVVNDSLLTDWQSAVYAQGDWSGGGGQIIFLEKNKFDSDDSNIDFSVSGALKLKEISTSTFVGSGYLVSSAFFATNSVWSVLEWEEEILESCPECSVKIQIQTADDNSGAPSVWPVDWCGPKACDNIDYFATSSGEIIPANFNGKPWLRYRLLLGGNGSSTPVVKNIKIFFR